MSRAEVIVAIKEKNNILVQKKLLTAHFAAELNDALVHDVVTSPAHSFHFQLKVQLENIMRLHIAIPMNLQEILYDFLERKQTSLEYNTDYADYAFLIGYLDKSFQKTIFSKLIEQLQNNDLTAAKELSTFFVYLDSVEQKTAVLNELIRKSNDQNSVSRTNALKALGAVFIDLDSVEQKTATVDVLMKIILGDADFHFRKIAIETLGAIFVHLDSTQKETTLETLLRAAVRDAAEMVKQVAVTALSAVFPYVNPEQKNTVLDKLVERSSTLTNPTVKKAAIIALGTVFAYINDPSQRKNVFDRLKHLSENSTDDYVAVALGAAFSHPNFLDELIEELKLQSKNIGIKKAITIALGRVFLSLNPEQQALALTDLIEKLNDPNQNIEQVAAALDTAFAYINPTQKENVFSILIRKLDDRSLEVKKIVAKTLSIIDLDPAQKTLFLEKLIEKFNSSDPCVKSLAAKTFDRLRLHPLSPAQKELLLTLQFFDPTGMTEIKVAQAILNFTIPNIYVFGASTRKLITPLLAVNNIFYQNFLNPDETNLVALKEKMTDLIRATKESQPSIGLFPCASDDTQLTDYFRLPESLKARILLKAAFGFPDESVIEFEKSFKKLMRDTTSSSERAVSHVCS